jgi:hypothetical protein
MRVKKLMKTPEKEACPLAVGSKAETSEGGRAQRSQEAKV